MTSDTTDSENSTPAPHEVRVPILQQLDSFSPTPDHVRGAWYANRVLGADLGKGDAVRVVHLDRVEPAFFERIEEERGLDAEADPVYGRFKRAPDLIAVTELDDLPPEFHPAADFDGGER